LYSYTDPCTGQLKFLTYDMSTPVVVSYYGQTKAFTSAEIQNGTFDSWLAQVYSNHLTSPCATVLAQQTATTSTNLTTNVVQNIMNLTTIASVASINLDIGGNVNNGSAPNDSKKDDNKKNGNNQSTNTGQNGQNNNTGSQGNSNTGNNSQGNGTQGNGTQGNQQQGSQPATGSGQPNAPQGSQPATGSGQPNTPQGNQTTGGTNQGSTQGSNPNNTGGANTGSTSGSNPGNNTGSSNPPSGNESGGSTNPSGNSGNTNPGNNSGGTTGNTGGSGNGGENSGGGNQGGNTGQGSGTENGQTSGTASGNNTQQGGEQGNPGDEKIQVAKEDQNKATSQQTAKTTSRARTTTQKPAILVTGDIVGLQQTRDTSNDARATVSYTRVKGDGSASLGVSADYMVNARISNVTLMRSWIKANDKGHKHINLVSGGFSMQPGAWSSTGMFIRVNSLKRFTAIYGAAGSYGYLFKEPMISTLAIGGFMYKGIMAKKIEATVIMAGVYSPYTKYYTETWWVNKPIVIPFFNLNYKVTKTFGMGLTGGGTYLAGQNVLNYQVLLGAKLIL